MAKAIFFRPEQVIEIEKGRRVEAAVNVRAVIVVGAFTVALVILAIILYVLHESEAGRVVIDLSIAFFSWCTGQAVGERAGIESH